MKDVIDNRAIFFALPGVLLLAFAAQNFFAGVPLIYNRLVDISVLPVPFICGLLLILAACLWCARRRNSPLLPQGRVLWGVAVLALVYSLLGNTALYAPAPGYAVSVLSAMGTMCLFWAFLKRLSLLFWVPFMTIEMVQVGAYLQYKTYVNNQMVMAESLEASVEEILSYATPSNLCAMALALLLACVLGWLLCRLLCREGRVSLAFSGACLLLLGGVALSFFPADKCSINNYWPLVESYFYPINLREAIRYNDASWHYVNSLPSPADTPSSRSTLHAPGGAVIVFHVGESVRADRMGINGYTNKGRSTTPWLDSQKKAGTLINFSDCISAAPFTCPALITIMTDARADLKRFAAEPHLAPRAGSVLDLFDANGFPVYTFSGAPTEQGLKWDMISKALTKCAVHRYNAPEYRHNQSVIPFMGKVLKKHPGQNALFFINNEGSHAPFGYYLPDRAPFQPSLADMSNPAAHALEVNNAYDNTIDYLDEYVRLVVEQLRGQPFIYIYVSDHGEYLGHGGRWGRGGVQGDFHESDACRVGMFVITSPEFEALHPHFAGAVKKLREHADMTVGHEHIYHTLLGLVGISSPYYDAKLDLCRDGVEAYAGPRPEKKEEP